MKVILFLAILMTTMFTACGDAPDAAIEDTPTTIRPTQTPQPSVTPEATNTPSPTSTPVPTPDPAVLRAKFTDLFKTSSLTPFGVDSVTTSRWNANVLELELRTSYASRERQPDVSFQVITLISEAFKNLTLQAAVSNLGLREMPVVQITTYSSLADYRYQSVTDVPTMKAIADKSLTFQEWVTAAGASFR